MLMIREFSSHSSHQKSSDSLDCPEPHVKRSVNCRSGAISLKRVNSTSNWPEVVEHGDASAVTTPVQVRCISRASEIRTSCSDKSGLQSWAAATCGKPDRARLAASKNVTREKRIVRMTFWLLMRGPPSGGVRSGTFHSVLERCDMAGCECPQSIVSLPCPRNSQPLHASGNASRQPLVHGALRGRSQLPSSLSLTQERFSKQRRY